MNFASPFFDCTAVIAGRARSDSVIYIFLDGNKIAEAHADRRGEWVLVMDDPLPSGTLELSISARVADGPAVDGTRNVVMVVPDCRLPQPERGTRMVPFSRELYVERDDFMEDPPRKFFRLGPGREVRLRFAYFVTCTDVIKDAAGEVTELRCTYDPATRGGNAPDGRKVRGTIHWVSAKHAVAAEVRLYDNLFTHENPVAPGEDGDFLAHLNPESVERLADCLLEPSLKQAEADKAVQFERLGYFYPDPDATDDRPVFNRTIGLRDSWAKAQAKS